nr:solute carrier family 28 member 3-like [Cherax quadricarinatus]
MAAILNYSSSSCDKVLPEQEHHRAAGVYSTVPAITTSFTLPRASLSNTVNSNVVDGAALRSTVDSDSEDSDDDDYGLFTLLPNYTQVKAKTDAMFKGHDLRVWWRVTVTVLLAAGYLAYFYAVLAIKSKMEYDNYWCNADGFLIIITFCVFIGMTYFLVLKPYYGRPIYKKVLKPIYTTYESLWLYWWVRMALYLVLLAILVVFLALDTRHDPKRLQSVLGLIILLLFGFVFPELRGKVRWRHVVWGMGLQFLLGLIILRWSLGRAIFQCVADKVSAFLATTDAGSEFVFGDVAAVMKVFAFSVLPVTVYFSFFVQILYYLGVMQWVVIKLGWFLQVTVGTTACESVNAAGNIFLGQTEAPLMIKPFMPLMTKSELHAVMTGGLATIAGSVLAAYISFGVDPVHLISASVMSAPAALAFAKLFYPETRKSKTGASDVHVEIGDEANVLHAAMVGVTNAIPIVANIAANLIAFIAAIELFNEVLNWACMLAGADDGTCSLEVSSIHKINCKYMLIYIVTVRKFIAIRT